MIKDLVRKYLFKKETMEDCNRIVEEIRKITGKTTNQMKAFECES